MKSRIVLGILSGGISQERYLSLRSGDNIIENLRGEGFVELYRIDWVALKKWVLFDADERILATRTSLQGILDCRRFDCIFNSFNGAEEVDGHITALLDLSGIPYVGNSFFSSFTGMNKIISKMLCREYGLPVVLDHVIFERTDSVPDGVVDSIGFPCILKPSNSGASIGIRLIRSRDELQNVVDASETNLFPYIVEPFIKGREYCITVIGPFGDAGVISSPAVEVVYPGEFFDEQCKKEGSYRTLDADLPLELARSMEGMAKRFHQIIQASVVSRTDFIVDDQQNCWILEINTHPGLGECSIVPAQVSRMGIPFNEFLLKLIEHSLGLSLISSL